MHTLYILYVPSSLFARTFCPIPHYSVQRHTLCYDNVCFKWLFEFAALLQSRQQLCSRPKRPETAVDFTLTAVEFTFVQKLFGCSNEYLLNECKIRVS